MQLKLSPLCPMEPSVIQSRKTMKQLLLEKSLMTSWVG